MDVHTYHGMIEEVADALAHRGKEVQEAFRRCLQSAIKATSEPEGAFANVIYADGSVYLQAIFLFRGAPPLTRLELVE